MDVEPQSQRMITMRLQREFNIVSYRNATARFYKGVSLSGKLSASK
jgi:hypothetical protein